MSRPQLIQTGAWFFLVGATLLSFWAAAHVGTQVSAIAAIMTIAAVKVIVVLQHFMDSERLTRALKIYFYAWPIGCAAMILGVAWLST
jgi:heme/copper-type cytochrome/quinol oxidase subunit 4